MRWVGLVSFCCLVFAACGDAQAADQAVSDQLIRLHEALGVTPAQEGAWRDYTIAIAPSAEAEDRHRAMEQLLPQLPTPRRIALIEANMERDMADFHRQGAAVIAFYQQLTPDQQRIFDAQTLPSADQPPLPQPRR
jgi:hypothetical protein